MLHRNVQVKFRLTQGEHFKLVRTAQEAGMSVAAFVRKCCLTKKRFFVVNRELLRDIYRELNYTGNNINQIARVANTLRHISADQMNKVIFWQEELCRLIEEKLEGIKYG